MIKNRITVGQKLILEVDADPTLNPTEAPVGSEALFNDAGVGKSYLKYGSGDTQWAAYQTGAEPSDWKFTTDANQLNVATAKAYFGTKAGSDFDIEFQRNGVGIFELKSTGLTMLANNILKSNAGNLTISSQAGGLNLYATQVMNLTAETSFNFFIYNDIQRSFRPGGVSMVADKESVSSASPADATDSQLLSFITYLAGKNRKAKLEISLSGTDGASAIYEKTIHMDQNNNLVLMQDDFSSKNTQANAVSVSVVYSSGQYQITLNGLAGITGKVIRMKMLEVLFM